MLRLSRARLFSFALAALALAGLACGGLLPQPTLTAIPAAISAQTLPPTTSPIPTSTETPAPSLTPTVSSTPTPSATPSPRPTKTATPQPKWVTDFAQPILDAIALRTPNFQDDFDDKSGGWREPQTNPCGQRVKILDGELVLIDCRAHRANMDYADFVVEFDARFLPDTVRNSRSSWSIAFRGGHFEVLFDGTVFLADLVRGAPTEDFSLAANPGLTTNHLLVIAKQSRFALYLNSKPFYYFENPSVLRQDDILLLDYDGSGSVDLAHPALVAFDNFMLWDISDISIP